MILTFEDLRKVKDQLPHGGISKIANELGVDEQTVRNYFGANDFSHGSFISAHYEKGVHGGYVKLDDTRILETAMKLIDKHDLQ